jgi:DNA-binding PadR family transcriptional regulator
MAHILPGGIMAKKRKVTRPTPHELDPLIHERLRLGILSALVVQESLSFTELRDLLQTTDGNLSVQARRLESAGYVVCDKKFEGRKPKSTYRLSPAGRVALEEYLETLSGFLPDLAQVRNQGETALRPESNPLPSHS